MKVYKLKHKPTGLFYTPSKGSGNLSTKGKIYQKKPDIKWTSTLRIVVKSKIKTKRNKLLIDFFNLNFNRFNFIWIDEYFNSPKEDWEIIEL
jgi:hypothetical protein